MNPHTRIISGVQVVPGWMLAITSLSLLLLLCGITWLVHLKATLPGLDLVLPATDFTINPSPDARSILLTAGPSPIIFYDGQQMEMEELDQRLAHASEPLQLILLADRDISIDYVMKISGIALSHGHRIALGGQSTIP